LSDSKKNKNSFAMTKKINKLYMYSVYREEEGCNGKEFSCGSACDGISNYETVKCDMAKGIRTACSSCDMPVPAGQYMSVGCPQTFEMCRSIESIMGCASPFASNVKE
jgi:hypothetical protein